MNSHEEIAGFEEIPVDLQVELDRKTMTLQQILDLDLGSVIRMTRSAGENIDLLVGGALTAFGEIVIIEDSMGVRITDFNLEE
ncbi:MAG: FliM/FliN family flagellar motor switch protein [Bryobacterales bacterium]|nr:FliM/FliN family flagellar motor switch protein [Bryobacterales bacterium]